MAENRCGFISAEEERYNTTLYESSLKLAFNIGDFQASLESTLYCYGISVRPDEEQYLHVASPFSRFWFFEEKGAVIRYEDDGTVFLLRPGQRYVVTPGHPFHITYLPGSVLYYAHFSMLDWTGQRLFRHAPRLLECETSLPETILKSTWSARCAGGALSLLLHIGVRYLFQDWGKLRGEYELCARFKPVFELIARTPPAQLRVGILADSMHMTQAAFSRSFRAVMGISPKDFLRKYYLDRADELLCFSGSSISETARLLGHDDIHNFFHAFKRVAGVSPAEYRSNRGKNS